MVSNDVLRKGRNSSMLGMCTHICMYSVYTTQEGVQGICTVQFGLLRSTGYQVALLSVVITEKRLVVTNPLRPPAVKC